MVWLGSRDVLERKFTRLFVTVTITVWIEFEPEGM